MPSPISSLVVAVVASDGGFPYPNPAAAAFELDDLAGFDIGIKQVRAYDAGFTVGKHDFNPSLLYGPHGESSPDAHFSLI
jgi:hypothetical protein